LAQLKPWLLVHPFFERIADRPWVALVELLLIGSVVYTVLRFLRGTRGARLVRAILIILAVSFATVWLIAEKLESERIKVLYPYFVLGVFLVSLVAFQTELRVFLARVGGGGWLRRFMRGSEEVIDPIVTAIESMSKKKIGALIAIARSPELGLVIESGVKLDAIVSAELLETLFWPGTTLHDLGVVIHGGRVLAAGCQFPLAESEDVPRELGSRHRAAIGMSREGDALVVIVSEETGTISVADHGHLHRGLTPNALRDTLIQGLSIEAAESDAAAEDAPAQTKRLELQPHGTDQTA